MYWRKSFLKKICVPVKLDRWERVHGVTMMPLLILKAAALMSWNWTILGFFGSHQGSKRSGASADPLMAISGTVSGISGGSLVKTTWQLICCSSGSISSISIRCCGSLMMDLRGAVVCWATRNGDCEMRPMGSVLIPGDEQTESVGSDE